MRIKHVSMTLQGVEIHGVGPGFGTPSEHGHSRGIGQRKQTPPRNPRLHTATVSPCRCKVQKPPPSDLEQSPLLDIVGIMDLIGVSYREDMRQLLVAKVHKCTEQIAPGSGINQNWFGLVSPSLPGRCFQRYRT